MSIKKIAERVGVSPATVSRVLNKPDYHCSSPQIQEKIWNAAIELNYTPNQAARNLKLGVSEQEEKTYYINVLMTRVDESRTDPFFSELLRVIESEIHKNFCILSKVWYMPVFSDDKKCLRVDLERMVNDMYQEEEGKCDGLIIIGKCNQAALKKLNRKYKSVVSVNRNSTNREVDEVICDGKKVAALAVEHLLQLGYEQIGYVGAVQNESRFRGFVETLQEHGMDLTPDYVVETKQTEAEGFEAMKILLRQERYPTGIYCANDITAIGVLKCLSKHKKLPYLPSVISSDDIEEAQMCKPMLTTVHLPKEEMGRFALYLLLDRLKGGHASVVQMELEGKLMIRSSCTSAEEGSYGNYNI